MPFPPAGKIYISQQIISQNDIRYNNCPPFFPLFSLVPFIDHHLEMENTFNPLPRSKKINAQLIQNFRVKLTKSNLNLSGWFLI